MKMIKKSKLKYKNGYLVKDGKIVQIDNRIVLAANELDRRCQRAFYEESLPDVQDVEPFEYMSERKQTEVFVRTPIMDKKIAEAKMLMDEIDMVNRGEKLERYFKHHNDLVQFVTSKHVVTCDNGHQEQFDLPILGNPLEWTFDDLEAFAGKAFGLE